MLRFKKTTTKQPAIKEVYSISNATSQFVEDPEHEHLQKLMLNVKHRRIHGCKLMDVCKQMHTFIPHLSLCPVFSTKKVSVQSR